MVLELGLWAVGAGGDQARLAALARGRKEGSPMGAPAAAAVAAAVAAPGSSLSERSSFFFDDLSRVRWLRVVGRFSTTAGSGRISRAGKEGKGEE